MSTNRATPPAGLYCLVAAGEKVGAGKSGGEWRVDDKLTVRLKGVVSSSARVREQNGVKQLLLPVKFDAQGNATFDVEVSW